MEPPFGGLYLALDTSGKEGTAALGKRMGPWGEDLAPNAPEIRIRASRDVETSAGVSRSVEILARTSLAAEEEHASLLIPRIQELLEEVGADKEELEGIVVGAGPGSFTGVRVGASTAKGLAQALELPLWAFSSLAAAAVSGDGAGGDFSLHPRMVLFDARGDRVYAAAYRVAHGMLDTLLDPTAATVSDILDGMIPPGALLMGEGALRHADLLGGDRHAILPPPAGIPTAEGLLRLLELEPDPAPVADPGRWEPDYLRASGAERMWKTRKGW